MKLLVVVPFFKNIPYLKETLVSLLRQTDKEWGAVVLDNSTDWSESLACSDLLKELNDTRIRYHKNPVHLDMASNWNQAFDFLERETEYAAVSIVHSDDRLLPKYVEVMRKSLAQYPDTAAFFARTTIIGDEGGAAFSFADWYKTLLRPSGDWVVLEGLDGLGKLINGNFVFCPTLCFNKKHIAHYRFENQFKMVIDFDLTTRLLLSGKTFRGYYAEPLYEYRRHGHNATAEMNKNFIRFREEHAFYQHLSKQLVAKNRPDLAERAAKALITKLNLAFQIAMHFIKFQWHRLPSHIRLWRELF